MNKPNMQRIPDQRMISAIGYKDGTALQRGFPGERITNLNLAIEGHSFVYSEKPFADIIRERINDTLFHNVAVAGSTVADCESRAATLDGYILPQTTGRKNVLILWIGVNGMSDTVGSGTTVYNELKSYVQDRISARWKVFVFTCTPCTYTGYGAQFEIERNVFNNLIRNDLSLINGVYVVDTDTIDVLDDSTNALYYTDLLHPTNLGTYFASLKFVEVLTTVYPYTINAIETPIDLTLTSTGTGAGVSQITFTPSEYTLITLNSNAKFYTDAAGTLGESIYWLLVPGGQRTIYLKCTSGTATFRIEKNKLTSWSLWTSGTNAASIGGSISTLTAMTYLSILGNNTLSGIVTNMTGLTYLQVSGSNTIAGNITALTGLTYINMFGSGAMSGDISALVNLTRLNQQSANNTLTGSVTNLTSLNYLTVLGSNTISGSVAGLTLLTQMVVTGTNTLTGSIAALTLLQVCSVTGSNTLSFPNVTNITGLCNLVVHTTVTLTSANVNQILADFWLNKDAAKAISTRNIDIRGNAVSGSPTGQGIIDKANLQAYRSPNPPGTASLWTVLTR